MLFTSLNFLYLFLPITFLIYYLSPGRFKNYILLFSSLVFYFYGDSKYLVLILIDILIAYWGGFILKKHKDKFLLSLILFIPLGLLIYFKYFDFILTLFNHLLHSNFHLLNLVLPLGISFYTFEVLSYLVDVYRDKINPESSLINLATYIVLFPKVLSGPLMSFKDFKENLETKDISLEGVALGIERFVIGLFKKVIIANTLASFGTAYLDSPDKSVIFSLFYALCYTLQVFFDFDGYSDMAIGLGKMFGFLLPENFDYPLACLSITDFWRRWHITLGAFFKEYVYIPLGGNKVSNLKLLRNILVVWILTGLWHGAAGNFVIWGLYYGVILIIEKLFLKKYLDKTSKVLRHVYVLIIVIISFVIFGNSNYLKILKNMFFLNHLPLINQVTIYYLKSYSIFIIIGFILSMGIFKRIIMSLKKKESLERIINLLEVVFLLIVIILTTSYLVDNSYNPFLYFKF